MYTEHFFVYYSGEHYADAKTMAELAEQCWQSIGRELGLEPTRRVRLYLAGSQTELEALCGGPEDFRLAGRARPGESSIVVHLKGSARDRQAVLAHELVHVALGQALEPHGVAPPQWLTEGLAEYIADLVTPGDQRRRGRGQLIPIRALDVAFPGGPQQSNLAYTQSRSFVEFVVAQTGDRGLRSLVRELGEAGNIEEAFSRAYGRSLADFEAAWMPQFARGLGRALPIDTGMAIFMAMGLLFVVVCVIRIARRRRRRLEEAMEDAVDELGIREYEDDG
ncbi:MAG: peptidase MA family metallohydrolase [Armatimonadota bacterium]